MKKILSILLVLLMLLPMAVACTEEGGNPGASTEAPTTEEVTTGPEGIPPVLSEASSENLKVMSFNVNFLATDSNGKITADSQRRIDAIRQEILSHNPDLVGLQEDRDNTLEYINLEEHGYTCYADMSVSSNYEHGSIWVKNEYTVVESGSSFLTSTGLSYAEDDASKTGCSLTVQDVTDPSSKYYLGETNLSELGITASSSQNQLRSALGLSVRPATYVVLNLNGKYVIYFNTHLMNRGSRTTYAKHQKGRSFARMKEMEILMSYADTIRAKYPDAVFFVTGDLNELPPTVSDYNYADVITAMSEVYGLRDAALVAQIAYDTNSTWNDSYNADKGANNFYSGSGLKPNSIDRIDYLFINDQAKVKSYKRGDGFVTVKGSDGKDAKLYTSDHLAVIVLMSIQTPGGVPVDAPLPTYDLYSGFSDTSWFTDNKTEYTLTTAEQFLGFMKLLGKSSGYESFEGITIKLGADLAFNPGTLEEVKARGSFNYDWPIYNSANYFKGTLDGQGHTISGVYLKCTNSARRGLLHGVGGNAVIKNLNIENTYFEGAQVAGKEYIGSLIARLEAGSNVTVSNVKSSAALAEGPYSFNSMGGLIAGIDASCTLTLENCEFSGTITSTGEYVGGLIGVVYSAAATVTIKNCISSGTYSAGSSCQTYIGYVTDTNSKITVTDCDDSKATILKGGSGK